MSGASTLYRVAVLSLLSCIDILGTLSQDTSTAALEGIPAYAVLGPGGNTTGNLLCVAKYVEENPPHRSWMSSDTTLLTFDEEVLVKRHSARFVFAHVFPVSAFNFYIC